MPLDLNNRAGWEVTGFFVVWLLTGERGDPTGWVTGTAIIMLAGIGWSLIFSLWPKLVTLATLTGASLTGLALLF